MHALVATILANTPEEAHNAGHEMLPLNPWAYGGIMGVFLLTLLGVAMAFRNTGSKH